MVFNRQSLTSLRHWPTLVVLAYTLAAFSWSMPADRFSLKDSIFKITEKPMFFLGLWQAWDMFAPNPRKEDIWTELRYRNRDGSEHKWNLSQMIEMPYGERWQRERWRKYFNDHLRTDDEIKLWRPFTEYALRHLRSEGQDPVEMDLFRLWRIAQIPVSPELRADVLTAPWNSYLFFHWTVPETPPTPINGGASP